MGKKTAHQRGAMRAQRFARQLRASTRARIEAGLGPMLPPDQVQLVSLYALQRDLDAESVGFVHALVELLARQLAGEKVDLDAWQPEAGKSLTERVFGKASPTWMKHD